jgi:hypothetical protein
MCRVVPVQVVIHKEGSAVHIYVLFASTGAPFAASVSLIH